MNIQGFYTGREFDADTFFGAHPYEGGTHFAVWAPVSYTHLLWLQNGKPETVDEMADITWQAVRAVRAAAAP